MTARWPDAVDDILGGDQAVMLASVTPADGVVLGPVTNFAIRDRDAGTVTVNSSIGAWKKLERIRRNPHVALAFHTREHGLSDRPEYVLVQGTATLSTPIPDYPSSIGANWDRFDGPRARGHFWNWWLRVYYTRISIDITVHRVIVWPGLTCQGKPEVHGAARPTDDPLPQPPPARGSGPRIHHRRAAAKARTLPHALLGWVDADAFPIVVAVATEGADDAGIALQVPPGVPAGGRRAGLTAHAFTRYVLGQHQQVHTGWLDVTQDGQAHYAPHTKLGYRLRPSTLLYRLAVGLATRVGLRAAHRAGKAFWTQRAAG